jgi:anti-sigma factor RsiW
MTGFAARVRFRRDHRWAPGHMSSYVDGELSAAGRRRMDRHVGDCAQCRRLLAGLRATVDALSGLSAPGESFDPLRLAASVRMRIQPPGP